MHLPPCIVTDIEYIHVSSKPDALRITTFGYGIWETLLDCSKDNNTQYISSSVTWSTDKVQHKDVFIESGGSLTITANVKFAGGTGIIVGKGGQLHVNGGTLTNACGTEWNGITVLGDPTQPFTDLSSHGFAQLMNSIVENACFGIRTSGSENSPAYYGGGVTKPDPPAGGIIYANHTKFINNHIDVSIAPCSNPKVDVFINCNFQISDDVLPPYSTHGPMVVLNDVNQVKFLCCNFTTLTSYRPDKAYGIGIKSTNSTFYVDPSCTLYNTSGCEQWKLSYFENLDYGVSATAFSSTRTLRIDTANFIGNNTGVYLSGISTAQVSRNIFTINSVDTNSRVAFGGVYLDQCNGYSVEQNTFSAVHLVNSVWSIGIVVNNSNLGAYIDANNKIYNNIFSSLDIGILPENKNRNNYDNAGLSILCNDFTQCKYDIAVTTDNTSILHLGIKNVQGENGNSPKQPAGNRFSPIPPLGAPHPDFRYHNECAEFTYYHHDQTGSGNNIVAPDPYYTTAFPNTITSTSVNQNNYTYKYICCPSNYTSGGGGSIEDEKSALKVEASSADSINNLLRTLVDGGNTTEVKSDVETSTTSEALAVYNFLLSLSPYLTDTVMVAALKQESVLTSDMITSILSENPQSAKSDTILQTIESRLNQLTDDQKAEIMLGLFITGAKESLESNLAASELNYSTSLNKILDYYASDSLSVSPKDSILHYTDGSPCLWARYHGIFALLDVKNKNGANQRMQALPNLFNLDSIQYSEHNFYNQLIGIYNNCADSGKSVLNCDSTTLVELNQVKQGSGGMAGIYARNILTSLNAGNYTEPYIFPKSGLKSLKIDWAQYKLSKSDELKIFPNPAKDYFIAEYSLTGNNTASLLRIIDNSGKLVKELSRHGDHEYLVVPVTDLTPGIYIVQLISDKNHILSAKLIVSR